MTKKSSTLADQIISLGEAAAVTGYSKVWISKLVEQGKIKRAVPGKFRLGDVVTGCIEAKSDNSSYTAARERVLKARAEAMELQTMVAAKDLVEVKESMALIERVLVPLKTDLITLGMRIGRDDRNLRTKIEDQVNDALQRAADRMFKEEAIMKGTMTEPEDDPDEAFFKS